MWQKTFLSWDAWTDGRMDGWMDGWADGRVDGWIDSLCYITVSLSGKLFPNHKMTTLLIRFNLWADAKSCSEASRSSFCSTDAPLLVSEAQTSPCQQAGVLCDGGQETGRGLDQGYTQGNTNRAAKHNIYLYHCTVWCVFCWCVISSVCSPLT